MIKSKSSKYDYAVIDLIQILTTDGIHLNSNGYKLGQI